MTSDSDCATIKQHRQRLEALLAAAAERIAAPKRVCRQPFRIRIWSTALAQYAAFDPIERQALLECDGVLSRCLALIELLEMKTMAVRGATWAGGSIH